VSTPYLNPLRQLRWRRRLVRAGDRSHAFYQYVFPAQTMCRTLRRIGFEIIDVRPYAVWSTMVIEFPVLQRLPLGRLVGIADVPPLVRRLGASCIWTARRP
jgi:hypothetical protein